MNTRPATATTYSGSDLQSSDYKVATYTAVTYPAMIYTEAIYTEITYTAMLDETFVALHRKPQMWSIYANPSGVEVRKIFI